MTALDAERMTMDPATIDLRRDMDSATKNFYDQYAAELAGRSETRRSAMSVHFADVFRAGERILDVGAGDGRDMMALIEQGCDVYGVEPNDAMRAIAADMFPHLANRIATGSLPALGSPFGGHFDGIVCSAVLMHVRAPDLSAALGAMARLLGIGGRLLMSFPSMDAGRLRDDRDCDGRLFVNHAPEACASRLARLGFGEANRWRNDVVLTRSGVSWHEQLFVKKQ